MKKYISSDPKIMSGQLVIAGTRIPLARILFLIREGYTLEEIQQQYPHVDIKRFEGAISELAEMIANNQYGGSQVS